MSEVLHEQTGITKVAARGAVDALLREITRALKKDGNYTIPNFGTLVVRKTKKRTGTNPFTKQPMTVKAGRTVRFRAAKSLRTAV